MKLLDNAFRYANQMGQRNGASVGYLNIFHADIEEFLSTKKINADEDTRMKTLSIGVVIPDKMIELMKNKEKMYLFYPHNVKKITGVEFNDIAVEMDNWYDKLVENPLIRKKEINPRQLMDTIAQVQGESGYPYVMFSDNVNAVNNNAGKVRYSNLCSEILQTSELSTYADYNNREEDEVGIDIACNLASGNIANMMEHKSIEETVSLAMEIMNNVASQSDFGNVPAVDRGNKLNRALGLGMMNLHGYLAKVGIGYGSKESLEFVDTFFNLINYYTLKWSNEKARQTGFNYYKFEQSKYADGSYFENRGYIYPTYEKVQQLFEGIYIPSDDDWTNLKDNVMRYGLANAYRQAIAPNGSTSYLMGATSGVVPIKQVIEERTYGNSKTFFPEPFIEVAEEQYRKELAFDLENRKIIDVIATIQRHVDQGISFEVCINSDITTQQLKADYLYAWYKGIKTLYYVRTNKQDETSEIEITTKQIYIPEQEECESCMI